MIRPFPLFAVQVPLVGHTRLTMQLSLDGQLDTLRVLSYVGIVGEARLSAEQDRVVGTVNRFGVGSPLQTSLVFS